MIKEVIFDIDDTLYDYEVGHAQGMKKMGEYAQRELGVDAGEFQEAYQRLNREITERLGRDDAAIHSRSIRLQNLLEQLQKPLFPHLNRLYHAYWDTLLEISAPEPGSLEAVKRLSENGISIGIGTDMTVRMQYEKLEVQVERIEGKLDEARMEMLKDIGMFDAMYEKNLEYFRELQIYIEAGEEKLTELREKTLPGLRAEAERSDDPMAAQLVNDFEETVSRFEKKLYDLKLSRTIAIQTAPQIKLIQNNDKLLVERIQTAVMNTIPVWKGQIVIALGLYRQEKTLKMQKEVMNTTNELLKKNSELLKSNTVETARASEAGIVEIDTLRKVNENLISTIEETLRIQQEGRQKRQAAEQELARLEDELRNKLMAARE